MRIMHVRSQISPVIRVTFLYMTFISTFVNAQQMFLESTLLRCNDEMAHEVLQNPIRQATSAMGQTLDLKVYSKCKKKLLITLRIAEDPKLFIPDALILIDRAKNSLTHQTSHFGVPLVLKFHQDPLIQKYPLQFLYRVNAKLWEEIINSENTSNYTGCDNNPNTKSPTCGFIRGRKEVAGFCCTCTDHKNHVQPRGGQRCDTPKKSPDLLTSAHCLRSSAYSYNVYELKPPSLFQKLCFDVFLGNETGNGSISWVKMSDSKFGVEVDADSLMNVSGSVKVSYRPHSEGVGQSVFNSSSHRLLLPVPNPFVKAEDYPNPLKGPLDDRILIVPKSLMAPRGAHCDLVGTRIEAFVNQPDACRRERNACLKNQPFDLWMQDQGEHGDPKSKFRLKSFGSLFDQMPFNFSSNFITGSLYMKHSGDLPSYVDIEIPADDIIILSPGYNAFIEFTLSDTGHEGVKIVTQVFNRELIAADFSIDLLHCSINISRKVTTEPKRIGPLGSVTFYQDLNPYQVSQPVFCFVVLVNEHSEAIAAREVVFHPSETCICSHTCKCLCGSRSNLKCERLSDENIIAAGLVSEIETTQDVLKTDEAMFFLRSRRMFHWMLVLLLIFGSLLLWGALKGLLGLLCCPPVALYGMDFYKNKFGASPNPSNIEIFWYNTTFFIFLPLIIIWWIQNPGSSKSPRNSRVSTEIDHAYDEEEHQYTDSRYDLENIDSSYDNSGYDHANTDSELDHDEHADIEINHENEMRENVNLTNISQESEASEVTLYERNSIDTVVNDQPSETGESTAVSATESKVDSSTKSASKLKKKKKKDKEKKKEKDKEINKEKDKDKKTKKKKSIDMQDLMKSSSGVKRKPINSYPFSAQTPDAASAAAMQRKAQNQKQIPQSQQQQKTPQPPQQGSQKSSAPQQEGKQGKGKSAPAANKAKDKKEHKPHRLRSLAGPGTGISERSIIVTEDPTPVHFPGSGGPQGETSWEVRQNSSNNNTNYPDFTVLNISASSSKTSFGTWHRRRREQFSAYDFLPESKNNRQSYTNYFQHE